MGFTMLMNQGTCDGLGLRKALLSRQLYSKAQPSMAIHGYPWHSAMLGKNLEPKAHGMWAMPVLEKTLAARPQKKKIAREICGHKTSGSCPQFWGSAAGVLIFLIISQSIHIHSDVQVILGLFFVAVNRTSQGRSRYFYVPWPISSTWQTYWQTLPTLQVTQNCSSST